MDNDSETAQKITRMRETLPPELVAIVITFALTEDKPILLGDQKDDILYPDSEKFWNAQNPGTVMSHPFFQYKKKDFYDICFQAFLKNNSFQFRGHTNLSINANPENLLVRKYLKHFCFEVEAWSSYSAIQPNMLGLCFETETITLDMGELKFHVKGCPNAFTLSSFTSYRFNSADMIRQTRIKQMIRDFVKGGKVRKLVLNFVLPYATPYYVRECSVLRKISREEVIETIRSVMAWTRKWFERFDGIEMLKVRGSLEGKILEQDEDVLEDEAFPED